MADAKLNYEFDQYALLTNEQLELLAPASLGQDPIIGTRINWGDDLQPPLLLIEIPLLLFRAGQLARLNDLPAFQGDRRITALANRKTDWLYRSGDEPPKPPVRSDRFTGSEVRVAVLDTGFELDLSSLPACVASTADFSNDGTIADRSSKPFHGTRIATVIAGCSTAIAPNAKLCLAKIYTGASSTVAQAILGICWAVQEQCQVLCLSSYFRRGRAEGPEAALNVAVSYAFRHNCLVISAGGNGIDVNMLGSGLSAFAICRDALCVGGLWDNRGDIEYSIPGSNDPHARMDCVAEASNQMCIDSFLTKNLSTIGGCSGATAVAAGRAALFVEWLNQSTGFAAHDLVRAINNSSNNPNGYTDVGLGQIGVPK